MNIVNVGYDSTNYYILADAKLLIDAGWPGTLPKLMHQCKRMSVNLADINYLLCTHYHPDHAGLAQELKQIGLKLIVAEMQISAVPILKTYMKPQNHYVDIDLNDKMTLQIPLDESRTFLAKLGVKGEIISTPGHSDDSVTLILDEGAAFTGDLPRALEEQGTVYESWQKIRAFGVKTVYPGHGPSLPLR